MREQSKGQSASKSETAAATSANASASPSTPAESAPATTGDSSPPSATPDDRRGTEDIVRDPVNPVAVGDSLAVEIVRSRSEQAAYDRAQSTVQEQDRERTARPRNIDPHQRPYVAPESGSQHVDASVPVRSVNASDVAPDSGSHVSQE